MTLHTRAITPSPGLPDLQRLHPARYPHLLQSVAHGRYDILFACPGDSLVLQQDGTLLQPDGNPAAGGEFLSVLDAWWQAGDGDDAAGDLPFAGGWFLYLGYELAGGLCNPLYGGAAARS